MSTVTREEARRRFDELLARLPAENEIAITDGTKVIAKLTAESSNAGPRRAHSALDFKPRSVGKFLRPFPHSDDDLLGEMLDNKFDPNK